MSKKHTKRLPDMKRLEGFKVVNKGNNVVLLDTDAKMPIVYYLANWSGLKNTLCHSKTWLKSSVLPGISLQVVVGEHD